MEKRILLAFILCFGLLIVWQAVFTPPPSKLPEDTTAAPVETKKGETVVPAPAPPPGPAPVPVPAEAPTEPFEEKTKVLRNDLLAVTVTNRAAGVAQATLETYAVEPGGAERLSLFRALPDVPPALAVNLYAGRKKVELDRAGWEIVEETDDRIVYRVRRTIPEVGDLEIDKTIRIIPGVYHLDIGMEVRNLGSQLVTIRYEVLGPPAIVSEDMSPGSDLQAAFGLFDKEGRVRALETFGITKDDPAPVGSPVAFGALMGNYFAAIVRPIAPAGGEPAFIGNGRVSMSADPYALRRAIEDAARVRRCAPEDLPKEEREAIEKKALRTGRVFVETRELPIPPGEAVSHAYQFFAGPKEPAVLKTYADAGYPMLLPYRGFLGPLVRLFVWLLGLFHGIAGSYGIAIALLTLLVRACLFPVNRKNQAAMQGYQQKIQKIQPELNRIKERYKNNRMKMNKEMQRVMKEHDVRPQQMLGGCLLILLQLPVWIALINAFQKAIELRHAAFLWVRDLTRPDHLFGFGRSLPLLGWEYFNLLPVLYIAVTVFQQRLQPKPKDPQMAQQQRMMSFMFIFIGVLFYNYSAGLLLYFLTSSILGIGESLLIKRTLAAAQARAKP